MTQVFHRKDVLLKPINSKHWETYQICDTIWDAILMCTRKLTCQLLQVQSTTNITWRKKRINIIQYSQQWKTIYIFVKCLTNCNCRCWNDENMIPWAARWRLASELGPWRSLCQTCRTVPMLVSSWMNAVRNCAIPPPHASDVPLASPTCQQHKASNPIQLKQI